MGTIKLFKKLTKLFILFIFLTGFLQIGFGQGTETFENIPANSSSSITRTWTGDDGSTWTATKARTDQTLNNRAITLNDDVSDAYVVSGTISGGVGDLTISTKRAFGGNTGTLNVEVGGVNVGTIPYSASVQTTTISGVNVSVNTTIKILNNIGGNNGGGDDRIIIDDVTWTAYSASGPEIKISGNSTEITDGDTTPDSADDTDFGSTDVDGGTIPITYTIENTGTTDLTISGYTVSAGDFSITTNPSGTVSAGSSTTIGITYDPSSSGSSTETVTITSDDTDEGTYTFDIKGTGTEAVNWCNVQWPETGTIRGGNDYTVYARVYEPGITDAAGQGAGINAWIGYSTTNNDPEANDATWTWIAATYNADDGANNDEYMAEIGSTLTGGTYYYASRFEITSGVYKYGGYNSGGGGFWDGATNVSGVLTVDDTPDGCNIQSPENGTVFLGSGFDVYADIWENNGTDYTTGAGQAAHIIAEIGYNTVDNDPEANSGDWTWTSATFNAAVTGNNDEYSLDLEATIGATGTYYYASRFKMGNGSYYYGGYNGGFWDHTYASGTGNKSGQLIIIKPEPTNYPTAFDCSTNIASTTMDITWTDAAAGTTEPDGYILKWGTSYGAIIAPVDGTSEADDESTTSSGVKNISFAAANLYTVANLLSNTDYYFKIWSYTNSGSQIDYKLGSEPQTTCTTLNVPVNIFCDDFEDNLTDWTVDNSDPDVDAVVASTYGGDNSTSNSCVFDLLTTNVGLQYATLEKTFTNVKDIHINFSYYVKYYKEGTIKIYLKQGAGAYSEVFFIKGSDETGVADITINSGTDATWYSTGDIDLSASSGTLDDYTIKIEGGSNRNSGGYDNEVAVDEFCVDAIEVSGPNITISTSTLTGFSYVVGNGPSSEQSFNVEGATLTNDILVTPPTDYEISTTSGGPYQSTAITLTESGGTVSSTTIYSVLKSGLSVGAYNSENIACTSTGATTKNVSCSGDVTSVPSATLADNGTQVSAGNVLQGSSKHSMYSFTLTITDADATLNQIDFTSAGTYDANDVTKLQLWYSTTNSLSGSTQLGSDVATPTSGPHSFGSLSQSLTVADGTYYFWITGDIDASATVNNTISIDAITTAGLSFTSANKSGSATDGGAQTITLNTTPTCISDLFISQVNFYNSDDSHYFEIVNYTNASINLDDYDIIPYYNGNTTAGTPVVHLSGTLAAGELYMVAGTGSPALSPVADNITEDINSTGNESFILRNTNTATDIDVFGLIGNTDSPDNDGDQFIRKSTATVPNTTYNEADWDVTTGYTGGDVASFRVHDLTCPVDGATIVETVAGGEALTIPALTTALSGAVAPQLDAVVNFDFIVTDDGGTGDANTDPTKITEIVISAGTGNDISDWTQAIASAELSDGTNTQTSNITIASNTITISSIDIANLGLVADGGTKTYSLKIALKTSLGGSLPSTIDGLNFAFKVNRGSFTVDASGSIFDENDGTDVESGASNNEVAVTASTFNYSIIPVKVNINTDFVVEVEAIDVNSNRELSYTSSVTLSKNAGSGTLSSVAGLSHAFALGIYQWTDIQMDTEGVFSILASDGSITDKVSSDINAVSNIKFQGFDGAARDNWTHTDTGDGAVSTGDITTNSGVVIHPYNGSSDNSSNNGNSWLMDNGDILVMDNVDISNYTSVEFSFMFAGEDVASGGEINLRVSYDGGTNWVKIEPYTDSGSYPEGGDFIADGYSGADWDFGSTNNPSTGAFYPDNPFILSVDDTKTQFMAEIKTGQYYYFDEVQLTGTFVPLTITTLNFMGATQTTAIVNADLENFGGETVTERGIFYGTSTNPTIADNQIIDGGTGLGYYTANLSSLTSNTTYYTRAYVITNESGTVYGNELSFTTCDGIGDCQNNTDLIISEYIESSCDGSGGHSATNNAIEIFNGTGSSVNLKHYRLQHDNNDGDENYASKFDFPDFDLPNNQTYVISNSSSNATELDLKPVGQADIQDGVVSISGDEQIQLLKTTDDYTNYTVIEHVGSQSNWGEEKTFARNPDILNPKTRTVVGDATCDPNTNGEWILYPDCYYDDLGSHRVGFDWEGDVDSDWFEIHNWNLDRIPTRSSTATISNVVGVGGVFPEISDDGSSRIAEAYKMVIESGAKVTILPKGNMSITGSISNSAGSGGLIIKSDATGSGSLILAGLGGVTSEATVERYITGNKWHYMFPTLSSIATTTYSDEGGTPNENLYSYDEATKDYWNANTTFETSGWTSEVASSNLRIDKGYIYNRAGLGNKTFSQTGGNLFIGQKDFAVTYNTHTGVIDGTCQQDWNNFDGWNLIGNPYASAIDWDLVAKTNIENGLYCYDDDEDKYQYYVSGGSDSPYDAVGVTINTGDESQYIPSGQGFMVKATTSGTFSLQNAYRVHNSQTFWKKHSKDDIINNIIRLEVEKDGYTDETLIRTLPVESGVTENHDGQYDAYKLFSRNNLRPQLFSILNTNEHYFAINSIPEFTGRKIVPLGLFIGEAGEYTINMTENNFDNMHVWLEDRSLSVNTNLLNTANYTFNQTAETNNDRFYLHFGLNTAPTLEVSIPDQVTNVNNEYQYYLPVNMFADADFEDVVTNSVNLVSGDDLPTWLSFNLAENKLEGIPNAVQVLNIRVSGTDTFGATVYDDFKLEVKSGVAISELNKYSVMVYPNPTNGVFTVKINNSDKTAIVSVSTITGKVLKQISINNHSSIDLSNFAKGIYFIDVEIDGQSFRRKIVIQ